MVKISIPILTALAGSKVLALPHGHDTSLSQDISTRDLAPLDHPTNINALEARGPFSGAAIWIGTLSIAAAVTVKLCDDPPGPFANWASVVGYGIKCGAAILFDAASLIIGGLLGFAALGSPIIPRGLDSSTHHSKKTVLYLADGKELATKKHYEKYNDTDLLVAHTGTHGVYYSNEKVGANDSLVIHNYAHRPLKASTANSHNDTTKRDDIPNIAGSTDNSNNVGQVYMNWYWIDEAMGEWRSWQDDKHDLAEVFAKGVEDPQLYKDGMPQVGAYCYDLTDSGSGRPVAPGILTIGDGGAYDFQKSDPDQDRTVDFDDCRSKISRPARI